MNTRLPVGFFVGAIILVRVFVASIEQIAASEGDTLLFDDFNDGNFNGWTIESGNWWINSGNLVGAKSGRAFGGRINTGSSEWDNYQLELDVNGFQGIDQGIGFRYTQNGYYEINLRYGTGVYDTPQIKLWKNNGSKSSAITENNNFPLKNQKWYHLKIEIINENIKAWIDNTLVLDYTDTGTNIKKGTVTLSYWTGDISVAYMRFDNIRIAALGSASPSQITGNFHTRYRRI